MTGTVTKGAAFREDFDLYDGVSTASSRIDSTGGTKTGLKVGNTVDVLAVYGDGTNRTDTTLSTAINAVGSNSVAFELAVGTWTISNDKTIPSNITLVAPRGVDIQVASGKTLTLSKNKQIIAGDYPLFTGDGTAQFSVWADVFASWWTTPQKALDSAANAGGGKVRITEGFDLGTDQLIFKSSSIELVGPGASQPITYAGTDAAIKADGTLRSFCIISNMSIQCDAANSKGIDYTWFGYSDFSHLRVEVREANSQCIYAAGNGLGTGPYYNAFDKVALFGRDDAATYPNQIAVQLVPAASGGFLADGPNRTSFSNFKRVAGFDVGFDIQSGNGNTGTNIHFEAIASNVFKFNDRAADYSGTATSGTSGSFTDSAANFAGLAGGAWKIVGGTNSGESGEVSVSSSTQISFQSGRTFACDATSQYEVYKSKAIGNKFTNITVEGKLTANTANFKAGGRNNMIAYNHVTSISSTAWKRDVEEANNRCVVFSLNSTFSMTFTAENLAANTTTTLFPIRTGIEGGMRMPVNAALISVSIAVNGYSAAGVGTGTVRIYKTNIEMPDASFTFSEPNRLGTVKYLKQFDSQAQGYLWRPQDNVSVDVITDLAWNQTTADVAVTLLFDA